MPWGDWINELPTAFFMVVHIAAFALGAGFAWIAFKRELTLLGTAFSLFAVAELTYMTYHLDWTVFLFAHTLAEVFDLAGFRARVRRGGLAGRGGPPARTRNELVTLRLLVAAAALAAASALGMAACGGSGEAAEPVPTTEVEMAKSYRFEPEAISIEAGATVTWTNDDNFTHTVQVDGQEDHKVERGEPGLDRVRSSPAPTLCLHSPQQRHGRRGDRRVIRGAVLQRDLVIVSCAISAGVHAALAPAHVEEGAGAAAAFAVSAVLLACASIALTRRVSAPALAGAAIVLTALLAGYALAVTSGLPIVHPEPESVDVLAVVTKAVELLGLVSALALLRPRFRGDDADRPADSRCADRSDRVVQRAHRPCAHKRSRRRPHSQTRAESSP